jgi:uncharacterized protein
MTLHTVDLDQTPRQPWRNGVGNTRELLAWPLAPAGNAPWRVRVSVADIANDGPFSVFPGVLRAFAVLRGAGVRLIRDTRRVTLTVGSPPWHFDGGQPPQCELIGGSTVDLNLMVLASFGAPRMQRADASARLLAAGPRWRGVFIAEGQAWLQRGAEPAQALSAGQLAWSADCSNDWMLDGAGDPPLAYWLSVQPTTP